MDDALEHASSLASGDPTPAASSTGDPVGAAEAEGATASTPGGTSEGGPTTPRTGSRRRRRRRKRTPPAEPALRTKRETSAGGVVYRRTDDGDYEIALAARRTRKGRLVWGLAKGGLEEGEDPRTAAVREVREELGLEATIEDDLGTVRYVYVWDDVRIRKRVHFFLMRATGGDFSDHDDEMEEVRWFPISGARKRAGYRGERDMIDLARSILLGSAAT